ncbi:transcriptional regulator [Pseudovibrio exalbescens]|uniref:helix-turn-helix transcriptional regulator n=1 Tax=Pseudovibrio exalbescens TaxID=197461 RepID=UPI0023673CC3|nr:metalloregulator ArsR/SmtB family transcription factor [Pseudovibrio exalbescens]MDD7910285.1 transcriptional regulator [Pseudovibrio exalbescens]
MNERTKSRLLYALKSRGPQTSAELAKGLGVTTVAIRQHLDGLSEDGLVAFEDIKGSVGRPKRVWSLSDKGNSQFPDNHSNLMVEMLDGIREIYGDSGIEKLIERRENTARAQYSQALDGVEGLPDRLNVLADQRSREGYMAEVAPVGDGSYLLIENHCSICAAAAKCQEFCRSELDIFREMLGPECSVVREEHIVSGARRCTYRVRPIRGSGEAG